MRMRMRLLALLLLSLSTPVCAQTVSSSSGAVSMVNISDPPATDPPGPNSTVTNRLVTPPNVVAPGLAAAGVETCLGSASGGLSLMGGGFTFGSTKVDEGCTLRLLARQLFAFGFRKAAVALMCQDSHVFIAMDEVGTPCPLPREFVSSDPMSLLPSAYADADRPPLLASADAAPRLLVDEADVKPFTEEEAALFARATAQE
jgi:hypothetical protein